jgi:hypothetical protein
MKIAKQAPKMTVPPVRKIYPVGTKGVVSKSLGADSIKIYTSMVRVQILAQTENIFSFCLSHLNPNLQGVNS